MLGRKLGPTSLRTMVRETANEPLAAWAAKCLFFTNMQNLGNGSTDCNQIYPGGSTCSNACSEWFCHWPFGFPNAFFYHTYNISEIVQSIATKLDPVIIYEI